MFMSKLKATLIGCSPLLFGLMCVGCKAPTVADSGSHCGQCDYKFANQTPNPCDLCVPYVELPCYGFTPTCWRMFPDECCACPPVEQPLHSPGPGSNGPGHPDPGPRPEELIVPPMVKPASYERRVPSQPHSQRIGQPARPSVIRTEDRATVIPRNEVLSVPREHIIDEGSEQVPSVPPEQVLGATPARTIAPTPTVAAPTAQIRASQPDRIHPAQFDPIVVEPTVRPASRLVIKSEPLPSYQRSPARAE